MKLEEASALADQIVHSIWHLCDPEHIMVVGSHVRRQLSCIGLPFFMT